MNQTCSHDGLCYCHDGVVGDKCDQCGPYHTGLSPSGCQPCSQCEQNLRTNLRFTEDELNLLLANFIQLMSLLQANVSGFEEVTMLIELLQGNLIATDQYFENILTSLEALNSNSSDFVVIINATKEKVSD